MIVPLVGNYFQISAAICSTRQGSLRIGSDGSGTGCNARHADELSMIKLRHASPLLSFLGLMRPLDRRYFSHRWYEGVVHIAISQS
jgi:hypothetical protein